MKIIVQKFGGTSVKDEEARSQAMKHIRYAVDQGFKVAVVVSAIGRKGAPYATDSLLDLVGGEDTKLSARELDMIVSVGEVISTAVMTELLRTNGFAATGMTGPDAGFRTNNDFQNAKVLDVDTDNIMEAFQTNDVVVVAGFQGLSRSHHVTTLGRGGSDTSAALLGAALGAEWVDIFTDVSGMMTGDPRIVKQAQFLEAVSYEEVANMANEGAKVIHPRAVEVAQQAHLPMHIRSTWDDVDQSGTLVTDRNLQIEHYRTVVGVTQQTDLTQFVVKTKAMATADVLNLLANNGISVDFINISPEKIIFNLNRSEAKQARNLLTHANADFETIAGCVKIAVIGSGMAGTPGITAKIVSTLTAKNITILQTTDSHTTIWVLVNGKDMEVAVNALHDAFLLNQD